VRSGHGEGRTVYSGGLRQSLEEEARRVKNARRGGETVVAEKVIRVQNRSLFYKQDGDEGARNNPPNRT
jgi:hypothetical protein